MRIYLSIAVGAAVLAAALNAGGCIGKPEYDKVLAGNRRLKKSLDKSLAAQRALTADNERLQAYIARAERQLDSLERLRATPEANGGP